MVAATTGAHSLLRGGCICYNHVLLLLLLLLLLTWWPIETVAWVVLPAPRIENFPRHGAFSDRATSPDVDPIPPCKHHKDTVSVPTVYGMMECVPISVALPPPFGDITILEASAEAQNRLVDVALSEEDDDDRLQDPYGAVLWPAASAVATYCLTQVHRTEPRRVLELGCGTGLVALALAVQAGSGTTVLATDGEALPLQLLQFAAQQYNDLPHGTLQTRQFDIRNATVPLPVPAAGSDKSPLLLVAADLLYDADTAVALAGRVVEALRDHPHATVVIGDSPGRPGRPVFSQELQRRLGGTATTIAWRTVEGQKVTGPRHALICGPSSVSVTRHAASEPLPIDILHLEAADLWNKASVMT